MLLTVNEAEALGKRIAEIEQRNEKVAADKAWEISWSRRMLLVIFTYLAISLYLNAIRIDKPWLHAIVPAIGFLLSTLTLPVFKELWKKYMYRR